MHRFRIFEFVESSKSTTALGGSNQCKFFNGVIEADTASYFTTDGEFVGGIGVTISAPGEKQEDINRGCRIKSEGILSLNLGGGTTRLSGTSMAATHVAGLVALLEQDLKEAGGGSVLPEDARCAIQDGADSIGSAPLDSPTTSYTFDEETEGIASAPDAISELAACTP